MTPRKKAAPKKRGPGRPKLPGPERVRLILRIPGELKKRLLIHAVMLGKRPNEIAIRFFEQGLEREGA